MKKTKGLKIAIIGGTGLVGPHLVQEFIQDDLDHEIVLLNRSGRSNFCEKAIAVDRQDDVALEKALIDIQPYLVIDTIPFLAQDAIKTASILQKLQSKPRVAIISSIDIYAAYARLQGTEDIDIQPCPIREDMALRTTFGAEGEIYDKLGVEKAYKDTIENLLIFRIPATYGWPDTRRISPFFDQMLDGKKEITLGNIESNFKFSRCLNRNAAFAIFCGIKAQDVGQHIYNVAEEQTHTELEWCQKIASFAGYQGNILVRGEKEGAADLSQHFYVCTKKIREETAFHEKYDPDQGLIENMQLYGLYRYGYATYKQSY